MTELIRAINERQVLVKENEQYFIVSQSVERIAPVEVLVFPSNEDGEIKSFSEVNGEREIDLPAFLCHILERGVYSHTWDAEDIPPY